MTETVDEMVLHAVRTSFQYQLQKAETRSAQNACETASAQLELARIRERLAEIEYMHEPLHGLAQGAADERLARKQMYAAAFYVVRGRHLPKKENG